MQSCVSEAILAQTLLSCSFSLPDLEITVPIRHSHNTLGKPECGIYEYTPRKNVFPPKKELKRGDWKTESTSSTASKQTLNITLSTGKLDGKHFPSLTLELAQSLNVPKSQYWHHYSKPCTPQAGCSQNCKSNSRYIMWFGHLVSASLQEENLKAERKIPLSLLREGTSPVFSS